ncbi:MAG: class IV adenylate cyclase [Holophaga sp.]|jgi:adenylate cyclase class 2
MKPAGPMEIEVKLRIPSTSGMEPLLDQAGFAVVQAPAVETSRLWDRAGELLARGCALRVRQYAGRTVLTWKGPKVADPRFKIRPEVETDVADLAALEAILQALGFVPVLEMVKTRSIRARGDLEACLDETPFGAFLELEGPRDAIDAAMAQLGLDAAQIEPRSYAALYSGQPEP